MDAINELDRAAFVARFGPLFEHSPWVAEVAWEDGPFADDEALLAAMVDAVRQAPRERQLALIRAHPELAGREAQAGELTAASANEQASAGLDRLTAQEVERWRALNRAYRERFDFPLVVCVREHTKASIMSWGEERLGHDVEEEVAVALSEIAKIARLRLEELDS
jgi:2-oxo-4-hydroxy-4-carboxy-5-ureidoimidazoline decarboxylase